MLSREEKYIYDWETRRGRGKWRYVTLTALVWGTIVPVLVAAFKLAFKGLLSFGMLFDIINCNAFLYTWLKFAAGFFAFALLMWHLAKKKYQELKRKQMARQELQLPR
ncbi:hypothetical protein [Taibaiella koreensis]|uniref:hypothetical protein n=1 Tax=Taibaiella koreensis TaxID=1268548 RepID=UPI000E5990D3|nr:hypothetical protein [Taibaiella koreensis]